MDNPSLDQALDTAWDNTQQSDVVEPEVSQPEVPEVTPPEVETPVEEQKPAEVEDKFTNIDPETLSEENKAIYKSLQADYTKKRQADSAKVSELEKRLKALETPEGAEEDLSSLTPEQIKELGRKEAEAEQVKTWREEAMNGLNEIDKRLNENHPDYEKTAWFDSMIRAQLDQELAVYEQENGSPLGFDYKAKAKQLISNLDGYVEEKSKAYLQKQSLLAKEKAEKLQKASPDVTNPETKRSDSMSIDEAIDAAFENS